MAIDTIDDWSEVRQGDLAPPSDSDWKEAESPKNLVVVVILVIMFVSVILAYDTLTFEPYDIRRQYDALAIDENIYIVYQDYRNLYSSVALVTWNSTNGEANSKLIVQGDWDSIKPKLYHRNQSILITWLERKPASDTKHFGFALYNLSNEKLGKVTRVKVNADPRTADHSFDGENFIIASPNGKNIDHWQISINSLQVKKSSIPVPDKLRLIKVYGPDLYFCAEEENISRIYLYRNHTQVPQVSFEGEIFDFVAFNGHIMWVEKTGGDDWGKLSYWNGVQTTSYYYNDAADGIDLIEIDDIAYLAFSEYLEEDEEDGDSDYEVRLGIISNISEPMITVLGEASSVDGSHSFYPFLVRSNDDVWVFWDDEEAETSLRCARVTRFGSTEEKIILHNAEARPDWAIYSFVISAFFPFIFFIAFLVIIAKTSKGKKEKAGDAKGTHKGYKDGFEFIHYRRIEPYFYFKFYFTVFPIAVAACFMALMMLPAGEAFGFRAGYSLVVITAITLIGAISILILMKTELGASLSHAIGYLITFAALIISLAGFVFHIILNAAAEPNIIYFLSVSGMLGPPLAIIGPVIILYGLSRKKSLFILLPPFIFIIFTGFYSIFLYSSLPYFPFIKSPAVLMTLGNAFQFVLSYMFLGMMLGMVLFGILRYERFKDVEHWTKKDLMGISNRAMVLSLLGVIPIIVFSTYMIVSRPVPDIDLIIMNILPVIFICVICLVLIIFLKFMYSTKTMKDLDLKRPSKDIYQTYLLNTLGVIIPLMFFAMFFGVFTYLVLIYFGYMMYKIHSAIKSVDLVKLQLKLKDDKKRKAKSR
ncbi:hypothetical protein [[Eubacterium] cellulosolvens]